MVSPREAALARAFALLTATLHSAGMVDGNRLAASMRLDKTGNPAVDAFALELAELVRSTIELRGSVEPVREVHG